MSAQNKLQTAAAVAEAIIKSFNGTTAPDAVAARRAELLADMPEVHADAKKDDLIAALETMQAKVNALADRILELEKPKSKDGLTVEQVARKFMEAPELALFTWPQIALLVHRVLPESKTSSKSIASYASKRKDEWSIVPREKFTFDPTEYMQAANQ